jgi:hypothetical protein
LEAVELELKRLWVKELALLLLPTISRSAEDFTRLEPSALAVALLEVEMIDTIVIL